MTGRGRLNDTEARELLETIAFQQLAAAGEAGSSHASRLAHLKTGGWQADVIRKSSHTVTATTAEEFLRAMGNPAAVVVFLPREAAVSAEIIERICAGSALSKVIVWEQD